MKKTKLDKKVLIVIGIAITIILIPLLINIGLIFTDFINKKTGFTLTANGLDNQNWFDFWKQYLTVIITFIGVCLVYISAKKDRDKEIRENNAQQYLEDVRKEENALVEIIQQFNPSAIYDSFLQHGMMSDYEGRKVLTDIRANIDHAHVKFEILTDLCDDFERCKKCSYNQCTDSKLMEDLRNKYYVMEKQYWKMLDIAEKCLISFENENARIVGLARQEELYKNINELINLYKSKGIEDISELVEEIKSIKERIIELEKSKLQDEEIASQNKSIVNEIDIFNEKIRPEFIRYTKIYIDMKKEHTRELRIYGEIKHKKLQEQD